MSKFLFLFFLTFILIISCSDSTKIVDPPPTPLVYQFSDYIHFDTTKFYILAHEQDSLNARPEPFMYWDFSLGEPFVDINGNNVYDVGIDIRDITIKYLLVQLQRIFHQILILLNMPIQFLPIVKIISLISG